MHITDPELVRSITHEWQGERDSGGRPLVAKDVIERMEMVTTEEAWGTLRRRGYHHSFAGRLEVSSSRKSPRGQGSDLSIRA